MISGNFRKFAALAPVLTLAVTGCFGGGGSSVNVMPAVAPAGSTAGFDDVIASAPGKWQIQLASRNIESSGNTITPPSISSTLIYDNVDDTWTVNIGGENHVLTWNPVDNNYFCDVAGGTCTLPADTNFGFGISDASMTKYGRFAVIWYEMDSVTDSSDSVLLGHTGLRTAADVMPKTGSATYAGTAFAFLDRGAKKQTVQAWGTTTITANFGATTSNMTLTGSLALDATGVAENGEAIYSGGTASMSGGGTITGNEFVGSVVTGLTGMAGAADVVIGGSMAGAFYGPAADEVVGYFDTAGTVTTTSFGTEDVRLMGGFATVVTP